MSIKYRVGVEVTDLAREVQLCSDLHAEAKTLGGNMAALNNALRYYGFVELSDADSFAAMVVLKLSPGLKVRKLEELVSGQWVKA